MRTYEAMSKSGGRAALCGIPEIDVAAMKYYGFEYMVNITFQSYYLGFNVTFDFESYHQLVTIG